MAYTARDWEELGRNVRDIVDQAVNQQDYQKLNENIRQTVGRAVDLGGEALRKAADAITRTDTRQAPAETKDVSLYYGKTGNLTTKGLAKAVGGGILTGVFGIASLGMLVLAFAGIVESAALVTLAGLGGGIVLLRNGIQNLRQVTRFKTYRRTLGQKTHCALEKLARSVGKPVSFVRKEVTGMIETGLFPEGHLDREETTLIVSDETYRLFETSRLQLEQRQREQVQSQPATPPDSPVQQVLDRGNAFITQIRRCNDAIPGEEISGKIDRMESIVRRIFDRAGTNPEVVPDLKKMMDYYLPMTVKLLNAYADMDAQPVQGENIQNAKREIEGTLDTLNLAFEKLLDSLFADTALDVSSDISVLQTMLAQEGLTDDGFTRPKQ